MKNDFTPIIAFMIATFVGASGFLYVSIGALAGNQMVLFSLGYALAIFLFLFGLSFLFAFIAIVSLFFHGQKNGGAS